MLCCRCAATETYQFYNLPFCTPTSKEYKTEGLGEVLEGDRLVTTPYDIRFRVDKDNELLCSRQLNDRDLAKFRKAVQKDYYFQASGARRRSGSPRTVRRPVGLAATVVHQRMPSLTCVTQLHLTLPLRGECICTQSHFR